MKKQIFSFLACIGFLLPSLSSATPVYLNDTNITVAVGAGTTATSHIGNNIGRVIDAASANASEVHSSSTHVWYSGGGLELLFDFGLQYDLTTLHFWNYNYESHDVDNIDFTFYDSSHSQVGALSLAPALGENPNIYAEHIALSAPLNVQFVTAYLTGTNNRVDFQNMGFTASLSTDRCIQDPNDPICSPTPVPEPSGLLFSILGLLGLKRLSRRTA